MLVLLLTVTVEHHDTVVQREYRLKDRTDKIGRDRHRRQQRVRTHIQHNRQQCRHQDDHRFEPALRHHKQHNHDQHGSENHHGNRRCRSVLAGLHHAVTTETGAYLLTQGFLINGFRHVQVKHRIRTVRRITIRDTVHILITFQQRPYTRYLIRSQPFEHNMDIRTRHLSRGTELSHHDLQTAFHLRVIRQVLRHIGIDVHMERHKPAYDSQCHRDRK